MLFGKDGILGVLILSGICVLGVLAMVVGEGEIVRFLIVKFLFVEFLSINRAGSWESGEI